MSGAHTSAWRSRLRSTSPLTYLSTTWRLPCGLIALSPQKGRIIPAPQIPADTSFGSLDCCHHVSSEQPQPLSCKPFDGDRRELTSPSQAQGGRTLRPTRCTSGLLDRAAASAVPSADSCAVESRCSVLRQAPAGRH